MTHVFRTYRGISRVEMSIARLRALTQQMGSFFQHMLHYVEMSIARLRALTHFLSYKAYMPRIVRRNEHRPIEGIDTSFLPVHVSKSVQKVPDAVVEMSIARLRALTHLYISIWV